MADELSSVWDGLSEHLIASFYETDRDGKRINESGKSEAPFITVRAPLTEDSSIEITQNWQSPFENVGQSTLPTLQQMLQSGEVSSAVNILSEKTPIDTKRLVATLDGKSSITKLNSTQVWTGSPPLKITISAVFRAWKDALVEVERPVNQIIKWSLPKYLAPDGIVLSSLKNGVGETSVMPSSVPSILAMKYKNKTYSNLVIESVGLPIGGPVDGNGNFVSFLLPITLASLASIDRADWLNYSKKQ